MPNRLANETSPYLLQHADNPVDWYPWGDEALARARAENKPILLSIGYAACHWCHVMAHESFEDPAVAAVMNDLFVNIKVDREERPDIDSIYMQAVQAMTGQGGWPMTMFLTPEGVPFHGGTYFPPADRHGMPSFRRVLLSVADAYREQPERVRQVVGALTQMYAEISPATAENSQGAPPDRLPSENDLGEITTRLASAFDPKHGGFGGAPKFPPTMVLEFLLTRWRRTADADSLHMAHQTFLKMCRGGIFDQIGGGFARYSVDERWLVPHFEKMLYDNALLIRFGAHLFQATGDIEVKSATEATITWAEREMLSPEGGFCSSIDADSEGVEGKFYVWSAEEFVSVLGVEAPMLQRYFSVTPSGNFEGENILCRATADEVFAAREGITVAELLARVKKGSALLMQARSRRIRPGLDDKVLASWNGLMVRGLFEAGRAFGNEHYSAMALRCADFLFDRMVQSRGTAEDLVIMRRTFSRGQARIDGFLEDYAAVGLAAVSAYQATFDEKWLQRALALMRSADAVFHRDGGSQVGLYFDAPNTSTDLIVRPRDVSDNALPSGNSLIAELLLLLGEYFGDSGYTQRSEGVVSSVMPSIAKYPPAFGHMMCAADAIVNGTVQLALIRTAASDEVAFDEMFTALSAEYIPALVLAGAVEGESALPLLAAKGAGTGGAVSAWLCRRYLCEAPVYSADDLREQINGLYLHGASQREDRM